MITFLVVSAIVATATACKGISESNGDAYDREVRREKRQGKGYTKQGEASEKRKR